MELQTRLHQGLIVALLTAVVYAAGPSNLDGAVQRVRAGELTSQALSRLAASAEATRNCEVVLEALAHAVEQDPTGLRARSKLFRSLMECERLDEAIYVAGEFEHAVQAYPATTKQDQVGLLVDSLPREYEPPQVAAGLRKLPVMHPFLMAHVHVVGLFRCFLISA